MNKRIVLISCVSKKLQTQAKVRDLYTSPLFKKNLAYARKLQPDKIFVLSSKYGLLSLDQKIKPYEQTLNNMSAVEIKKWAAKVAMQLKEVTSLKETEFTLLAGEKYRRYLLPYLKYYKIPLKGLSIGKQLKKLKELTL